jgi:hypothetical protein
MPSFRIAALLATLALTGHSVSAASTNGIIAYPDRDTSEVPRVGGFDVAGRPSASIRTKYDDPAPLSR